MKLSDITGLVSGRVSPATFRAANAADFAERGQLLSEGELGAVIPVRVEEDQDVEVTLSSIVRLCELFNDGAITEIELGYIADALQLTDRTTFLDEEVADYLAEFTDPEINGAFTVSRAQQVISEIEKCT